MLKNAANSRALRDARSASLRGNGEAEGRMARGRVNVISSVSLAYRQRYVGRKQAS